MNEKAEAERIKSISHPFVIHLFEHFCIGSYYYLVYE